MLKFSIYAATAGNASATYRASMRDNVLPTLLAERRDIAHCTLNLVDDALTGGLPGAKMGAEDVDTRSPYDLVTELWVDGRAADLPGLIQHGVIAERVAHPLERQERDDRVVAPR